MSVASGKQFAAVWSCKVLVLFSPLPGHCVGGQIDT